MVFLVKKIKNHMKGSLLLELLIAVGVFAIVLPPLIMGFISAGGGKAQQNRRIEAIALLRETEEAVRSVREKGWSSFATNGTYHPIVSSTEWSLVAGTENVNGLTRSLEISSVSRDSNGVVVTSGGTIDPSTKKVDITISWGLPFLSEVTSTMYVTRYVGNNANSQTSQADFNLGNPQNTQVSNTSGGEVKLAFNTKGKWCEPNLSIASVDLPGTPNSVWGSEGNIYVSSQQTTNSFMHVEVSNTDPPTSSFQGKLTGYEGFDVFGDGSYGYIATSNNTKEVVIINLNQYSDPGNQIYQEAGYFNTVTNTGSSVSTDANAIFVMNNRGYVTADNYLYVFDLSSKSGSRPRIGNRISFANTGDTAGQIYGRVVGSTTYIFIAVQGSTVEELKVLNVTNHNQSSQWRVVGDINIEPNNCSSLESGKAVYVNPDGTRAFISSTNDVNFKEFFTINTSNKSNPSLVGGLATNPPCTNGGGYEAGGMDPEQSVVVSLLENRAIVVGLDNPNDAINSKEYQVLDLTNEANPTYCGGLDIDAGIIGITSVKEADGDAFSYIITNDASNELKIIQGGPDGTYLEEGVYDSVETDLGSEAALNRLNVTSTVPVATTLTFQIAGADQVNGSCVNASYTYVGPDGTNSTFYPSTGGVIPFNDDGSGFENPARCVKYRAYLSTTNYNLSPEVLDVSLNYSP
ncbi:MAG: hypothetical protein QG600_339 [Patescibacteria group bacterium]|nr:hypothetical protein [Patescibacteria group bacterium]